LLLLLLLPWLGDRFPDLALLLPEIILSLLQSIICGSVATIECGKLSLFNLG
jgi:hypothetical protein